MRTNENYSRNCITFQVNLPLKGEKFFMQLACGCEFFMSFSLLLFVFSRSLCSYIHDPTFNPLPGQRENPFPNQLMDFEVFSMIKQPFWNLLMVCLWCDWMNPWYRCILMNERRAVGERGRRENGEMMKLKDETKNIKEVKICVCWIGRGASHLAQVAHQLWMCCGIEREAFAFSPLLPPIPPQSPPLSPISLASYISPFHLLSLSKGSLGTREQEKDFFTRREESFE